MLSDAAKELCGRWFSMGTRSTLVSHDPHATLAANQAAIDELVAAGTITRESYNDCGSVLFRGTPASQEIGEGVLNAALRRMFDGPDHDRIVEAALRDGVEGGPLAECRFPVNDAPGGETACLG